MSLDSKIEIALKNIGKYYVQELRKQLTEGKKVASGDLLESISSDATKNVLKITANRYLGAISDGKKATGKAPSVEMVSKVAKWMQYKKLPLRGYKGRFQRQTSSNYRRAAFAVARSINRSSWEGSNVIKKSFKAIEGNINSELVKAYKSEVKEIIDRIKNK